MRVKIIPECGNIMLFTGIVYYTKKGRLQVEREGNQRFTKLLGAGFYVRPNARLGGFPSNLTFNLSGVLATRLTQDSIPGVKVLVSGYILNGRAELIELFPLETKEETRKRLIQNQKYKEMKNDEEDETSEDKNNNEDETQNFNHDDDDYNEDYNRDEEDDYYLNQNNSEPEDECNFDDYHHETEFGFGPDNITEYAALEDWAEKNDYTYMDTDY